MQNGGAGGEPGASPISMVTDPGAARVGADTAVARSAVPMWVIALALASGALVAISNLQGIAIGDDGVGYRAIADSLVAGDGLGYFLDDPLTIWPPVWPALMALIALLTPLDPMGAAVALNVVTAFVATIVGYGLLARVVNDRRLVICGTAVMALGGSTIGFGHLLMTDLAFAVVVMVWLRCLMAFWRTGSHRWVVAASVSVWVGFGLRYVALYLLALGCLWLLIDLRRTIGQRLVTALGYGALGIVAPLAWMLRNHAIDGTFTGVRTPSARGPIGNAFDVLATMGQWVLPGIAIDALKIWAVVGMVVLVTGAWIGYRVLTAPPPSGPIDTPLRRFLSWVGSPSGLLAVAAFGYLTYMVYVRSSTSLNRLELRLLNPAYFSLIALTLVLVANLGRLDGPGSDTWARRGRTAVMVWAVANVAVGLYATVSFASGDPFLDGNYNSDVFMEVRDNPALESVPEGCQVYSNLPNALYPALEAQWSPRRTALESTATTDDLDELAESLRRTPACLVWIDEPPEYGHLWTREQLSEQITLEQRAHRGPVTVYLLEPGD